MVWESAHPLIVGDQDPRRPTLRSEVEHGLDWIARRDIHLNLNAPLAALAGQFVQHASLRGFAGAGVVLDHDDEERGVRRCGEGEGMSLHSERRGAEIGGDQDALPEIAGGIGLTWVRQS